MARPEPCPHPYPAKLTFIIAEEVRRLHRAGASVKSIARRYHVAPSSISAILRFHVYAPNVVALALGPREQALLREFAKRDKMSDEELAADLVAGAMHRRTAREFGVKYDESAESAPRRRASTMVPARSAASKPKHGTGGV